MLHSISLKFLSIALFTVSTSIWTIATTANSAAAQATNHSDATCENALDDYLSNVLGNTSTERSRSNQALSIIISCMSQYDELVRNDTSRCNVAVSYGNRVSLWIPFLSAKGDTILSSCGGASNTPAQTTTSPSNGTRPSAHSVWLNQGGKQLLTGQFYENERIYGNCDNDCRDLDLNLYSIEGRLVSSDVLADDIPIVVAPYDGTFTIEVTMHNCSHPSGCAAQIDSDYGF